jgi:tRNA modification GTPase
MLPTVPDSNATFAVLLTPLGRGAVASLLVAGPAATEIVAAEFRPLRQGMRFEQSRPGRIVLGRWGETSEELVACRISDERVELHCHGGRVAAESILGTLVAHGCQRLGWPSWIEREEPDPIAAAARLALAEARTERTAGILLQQYAGALRSELAGILQNLDQGNAAEAAGRLQILADRACLGRHLTEPWQVVLAGRPNVGKSSLINALVGYQRAIVFDQPGTTRDVVTAATAFDGWPVALSDTAGLRTTGDPLESAGIERATRQMEAADCLLLIFDAAQPWTVDDAELAAAWPRALIVHNKSDLAAAPDARPPGIWASAVTGQGLDAMIHRVVDRLVPQPPAEGAAVPFTPQQQETIRVALEALRQGDLAAAAEGLRRA